MSLFRNFFQAKAAAAEGAPAPDELYAVALQAYQAKDFARAITLLEQVIAARPDYAEAHYKRGNACKDLGQLESALASYDSAIQHNPDFQYAWCNRGVVQQALGLTDAALASFERAAALDPNDVLAQANRGSLLASLRRWDQALASFDRVLALNPQLVQIWFNRGNVLRELRQPQAALASYRHVLQLQPDSPEAHYNCAVLLEGAGKPHEALASYERALALRPQFQQAHYNRAGVLKGLNQLHAALDAYDRAIACSSDYPEAHANRGVVLEDLQRWDEALVSYRQAVALRPDYAEYHLNCSLLLKKQMQWDAALASCDAAMAVRPDYAQGYFERAGILLEVGRATEAMSHYDRTVAIQPDFAQAHYNRALAQLLLADYANGWSSYEWRWANADKLSLDGKRAFNAPLWLGKESIAGKRLLVYGEQGLGDVIQFCRFIKSVARLGATVILEVQAPLVRLLQGLEGVSRIVAVGEPLPQLDYRCPVMSLPLALGTTLATIPDAAGYLRSDPAKVASWRARLGPAQRPRIGLVWSGNARQGNDHNRSFALRRWIEHLPRELDYVCLQKDIRPADQETLADNPWIRRYDDQLCDFSDTAALCECLDRVISVCTSVAHLSGALGRPTWVLLPFNPDWRWLLDRTDCPWYQSVRLYRQESIGDWKGVFTRVAADLAG